MGSSAEAAVMFCTKCGTDLPDDSQFCRKVWSRLHCDARNKCPNGFIPNHSGCAEGFISNGNESATSAQLYLQALRCLA